MNKSYRPPDLLDLTYTVLRSILVLAGCVCLLRFGFLAPENLYVLSDAGYTFSDLAEPAFWSLFIIGGSLLLVVPYRWTMTPFWFRTRMLATIAAATGVYYCASRSECIEMSPVTLLMHLIVLGAPFSLWLKRRRIMLDRRA